jgi:hypothetical protein
MIRSGVERISLHFHKIWRITCGKQSTGVSLSLILITYTNVLYYFYEIWNKSSARGG